MRVGRHYLGKGRWSGPLWLLHRIDPDGEHADSYLGGVGPVCPGESVSPARAHRRARIVAEWAIRTGQAGTRAGRADLVTLARHAGVIR